MEKIFLQDLLERFKENHKVAIKFADNEITYQEWYKRSKILSRKLKAITTKNSCNIGIFLPNSIDYAVAYFSVLFSDKIIVPINIQSKENEIISTLTYCEIDVIITSLRYSEFVKKSLLEFEYREILLFCDNQSTVIINDKKPCIKKTSSIKKYLNKDDVAIMLHTSGTTNNPKRVMLSHDNLINNIESNIQSLKLTAKDKTLITLPMSFGYCNSAQFLTYLYLGAPIIILDSIFLPKKFFEIIEAEKITMYTGVPSILLMILDYKYSYLYDFSSLRYICFGGGKMPIDKLESLIKKYPSIGFVQTYGQTECSPRVTALLPEDALKKIGSVGRAIPNVTVRIFDKNQEPVLENQTGEIVVKGKNVMKGYFKHPKVTNNTIRDGWLHTGDMGYLDAEGYLYLNGRIKNIIISGGINIYPEEIEQILLQHESVEDVYVYGQPHKMRGEIPIAKVVLRSEATETQLKKYCSKKLAEYKVPVRFDFVESLSKTYNGKLKREWTMENEA